MKRNLFYKLLKLERLGLAVGGKCELIKLIAYRLQRLKDCYSYFKPNLLSIKKKLYFFTSQSRLTFRLKSTSFSEGQNTEV